MDNNAEAVDCTNTDTDSKCTSDAEHNPAVTQQNQNGTSEGRHKFTQSGCDMMAENCGHSTVTWLHHIVWKEEYMKVGN